MAGRKGMKHARGRTQEERDKYALARIEQIYDSMVNGVINCPECNKEHPIQMDSVKAKMLADRYRTLRPVLASSEVKMRIETMSDVLKRISDERIAAQHNTTDVQLPRSTPVTH